MNQLIDSIFQDMRAILLVIFMLIILGAFFGATNENIRDQHTRDAVDSIERNTVVSLGIILWGIGITGTIGTLIIIVSFIRGRGSGGFL